MADDPLRRIKAIKARLETAQAEEQRLQGKRDALMDRLRDEFGFASLADADTRVEELRTEVSDLAMKLDDRLEELDQLAEALP